MVKNFVIMTICVLVAQVPVAQTTAFNTRSQLSIMVVPYTSKGEDVLSRIEKDPGYKEAIAAIHSALLQLGYKNLLDFVVHKEVVDKRRALTRDIASSQLMKIYIEDAPVDILIEAEILWTDPSGKPTARKAQVLLKAVDKYTGAVYSHNTSIESYQREFTGIGQAVRHAITKEGAAQFNSFLQQLDASYAVIIKEGRSMLIKFETGIGGNCALTDRIGRERLSDKIGQCIEQHAFNKQFKPLGEDKNYMDFQVQVPVLNENGQSVSPSSYLRKKVDETFFDLGYDVDYSIVGAWINFTLLKKNRPGTLTN